MMLSQVTKETLVWRKIAITLSDFQKGEEKAHACEMACFRQQ
jgi:hypothetical protein